MRGRLRALIGEDSPTILENLLGLFEDLRWVGVVGTVPAEADACAWMDAREQDCDVAIIDMLLSSETAWAYSSI